MPWEIKKTNDKFCVYKKGESESLKCYDNEEEAKDYMKALYAREHSIRVIDDFVVVSPGSPYRLFPFRRIVKGGVAHDMTPEIAGMFKLPHFKPPIKLGSHEDATPAGGHIVGLEVREDGLYAIPELNEIGSRAFEEGSYRYHSPEVLWEGYLEDPHTGAPIDGPLILGDALLHTPHLGEEAALYTIEPQYEKKEDIMAEDKNIIEQLKALIERKHENPDEPRGVDPDEYKAVVKARDDFKAELDALKAEAARKELVTKYEGELAETKANAELAALLAEMPEEVAAKVLQEVKALSAQIDETKVMAEVGKEGDTKADDPVTALSSEIERVQKEDKVDYNAALNKVKKEHPELVHAVYGKKAK